MKNKQCILCKRSNFIFVTKVGRSKIFECSSCELGITDQITGTKKKLYGSTKYYSTSSTAKNIENYLKKYERIIQRVRMFTNEGKLLDVGGGFGIFSALISRNRNFKVTVLEPNLKPLNSDELNKVKWIKKDFIKFRGKKRSYSLITFLDVLEHFKNPLTALHKTRELLKFGGFVIILVPNYKSAMRTLSTNWPWWMVEDHYFHFSRKSLKILLAQAGFRLKYLESFENEKDLWASLSGNYSKIKSALLKKTIKALTLPIIFIFYMILRPLLWRMYNGGLLLGIAQKK